MEQGCADEPVVVRHDAESFDKRCLSVARGHAFVKVVDGYEMCVVDVPGLFHHSDAPVEV